ncbi:hypothetical protein HXX76_011595 [Chlamydomonas incerta]|uniref:Uncharacterized protein n=1 Tax=Chlamydomonas incerta TaxID=51695 RepID=A0A835SNQ6_CHLIN|nr:hypothetical protein HXX76_011595 [Chlamydomonas incerta]|eukprot:KAG2428477.1 hypothetical protein HXX76_011595 [Chlamydomonas incerta]
MENNANACVLSADATQLTIAVLTPYVPGATSLQLSEAEGSSLKLVTGRGTTGPRVAPLPAPQLVRPGFIASAATKDARTVLVTLPTAVMGAGPTAFGAVMCQNAIEVARANGTAHGLDVAQGAPCVLSTTGGVTTLTVALAGDMGMGDTVRIKAPSPGLVTASGALMYEPTAPVPIRPAHIEGAAIIGPNTFVVTLPYPSVLSVGPSCSGTMWVTAPDGKSSLEAGCTIMLDATGRFLTVNLASGAAAGVLSAAGGVGFAVKSSQTSLGAISGVMWAPPSSSVWRLSGPAWGTPASAINAVATSATSLEIQLPMPSYLGGSGSYTDGTATAGVYCASILSVAQAGGVPLALDTCTLADSPTGLRDILVVRLVAALGSADATLTLTKSNGALKAGSGTGPAYGALPAAIRIRPTFMSAVATGPRTLVVTLPLPSAVYKREPTCSSGTGSCTSGTATCASGLPSCSDGTGTYTCTATAAATCPAPVAACPCTPGFTASCNAGTMACGGAGLATPLCTAGGTITCSKPATCDVESATPACNDIFTLLSMSGAGVPVCSNPSTAGASRADVTVLTLTSEWLPGDRLTVNQQAQAGPTATSYLRAAGYAPRPSGDLIVQPSISLAVLTSARTITVTLPVPSSVPSTSLTAADCNSIFWLFLAGSATPRSNSVWACELGADKQTVTLTLAPGLSYSAGDTLNVVPGQTLLRADSASPAGRVPYAPLPYGGLRVRPTFVSAVATTLSGAGVIRVQLPVRSYLSSTDCTSVHIRVTPDGGATALALASVNACTLSADGTVPTLTLASALPASWFTRAPAYVTAQMLQSSWASLGLYAGADATVPLYPTTAESAALAIVRVYDLASPAPQSIVSAVALSPRQVEVEFPAATALAPAGLACTAYLDFQPAARFITACEWSADGKFITITTGADLQVGEPVQLVSGTAAVTFNAGSGSPVPYPPLAAAVPIAPTLASAYTIDASTIGITLPVPSGFVDSSQGSALALTSLTGAECDMVLAVKPATATAARRPLAPVAACNFADNAGSTTLTVRLACGGYGFLQAGDTVEVLDTNAGINGATAAVRALQAFPVTGGPKYAPRRRRQPPLVVIQPRATSARAVSINTVELALPVPSVMVDGSSGKPLSTVTAAMCNAMVVWTPKPIQSCSLSADGRALTLALFAGAAFSPGDVINIATGQTLLRAWQADVLSFSPPKLLAEDGAACFISGASITVRLSGMSQSGIFSGGDTSLSPLTVEILLPAPSTLASATMSTALSAADCATILTFSPPKALAAGPEPCVLDATYRRVLTVSLAAGSEVGPGDTVNIAASSTAAGAQVALRAGLTSTGVLYAASPSSITIWNGSQTFVSSSLLPPPQQSSAPSSSGPAFPLPPLEEYTLNTSSDVAGASAAGSGAGLLLNYVPVGAKTVTGVGSGGSGSWPAAVGTSFPMYSSASRFTPPAVNTGSTGSTPPPQGYCSPSFPGGTSGLNLTGGPGIVTAQVLNATAIAVLFSHPVSVSLAGCAAAFVVLGPDGVPLPSSTLALASCGVAEVAVSGASATVLLQPAAVAATAIAAASGDGPSSSGAALVLHTVPGVTTTAIPTGACINLVAGQDAVRLGSVLAGSPLRPSSPPLPPLPPATTLDTAGNASSIALQDPCIALCRPPHAGAAPMVRALPSLPSLPPAASAANSGGPAALIADLASPTPLADFSGSLAQPAQSEPLLSLHNDFVIFFRSDAANHLNGFILEYNVTTPSHAASYLPAYQQPQLLGGAGGAAPNSSTNSSVAFSPDAYVSDLASYYSYQNRVGGGGSGGGRGSPYSRIGGGVVVAATAAAGGSSTGGGSGSDVCRGMLFYQPPVAAEGMWLLACRDVSVTSVTGIANSSYSSSGGGTATNKPGTGVLL